MGRLTLNAQKAGDGVTSRVEERASSYARRRAAPALTAPNGPTRSLGSTLSTGLSERGRRNRTTEMKESPWASTAERRCWEVHAVAKFSPGKGLSPPSWRGGCGPRHHLYDFRPLGRDDAPTSTWKIQYQRFLQGKLSGSTGSELLFAR